MIVSRGGDIQYHKFVSTFRIVAGGQFSGVAGISQAFEVHALHNARTVGVEAGNDAVSERHAARRRKFSSSFEPGAPLFSG